MAEKCQGCSVSPELNMRDIEGQPNYCPFAQNTCPNGADRVAAYRNAFVTAVGSGKFELPFAVKDPFEQQ